MSAALYATIIFDHARNEFFDGCNKTILDAVEALDGQMVEVRETRFKFEPHRIRFYVEIYTSFDDLNKPLSDEDEATSHIEDKLIAAGITAPATILVDVINSELVPKSELQPA